jgi:transposase-like protein
MQRRQWTSEKKALIVLSGLKGQSVASICNEHGRCHINSRGVYFPDYEEL